MMEEGKGTHHSTTAIFADPSTTRQIALAKVLMEENASVALLFTPYSKDEDSDAQIAAKQFGVRTSVFTLNNYKNPKKIFEDVDAQLVLHNKDKSLFKSIPLDSAVER